MTTVEDMSFFPENEEEFPIFATESSPSFFDEGEVLPLEALQEAEAQFDPFQFVSPDQFDWMNWGTGAVATVDMRTYKQNGTLDGLYIPYTAASTHLQSVLDKLIEAGLGKRVTVKHSTGTMKDNFQFTAPFRVFPMYTGLVPLDSIIPNDCYRPFILNNEGKKIPGPMPQQRNTVGIFNGRVTILNKTVPPTQSTMTYVRMMFVIDRLVEYGYIDTDGTAKPLKMNLSFYAGRELYNNVLRPHTAIVAQLRRTEQFKHLEPWMLGMYMVHEDSKGVRGRQEGRQSQAYEVNFKKPYEGQLLSEYAQSMFAPPDIMQKMTPLIYEARRIQGKIVRVPSGKVMRWCWNQITGNIGEQRRINPVSDQYPYGELTPGKNKPMSSRLMAQYTREEVPNPQASAIPAMHAEIDELKDMLAFFRSKNEQSYVEALESALEQIDSGNLSMKDVQDMLKDLRVIRESMHTAPTGRRR